MSPFLIPPPLGQPHSVFGGGTWQMKAAFSFQQLRKSAVFLSAVFTKNIRSLGAYSAYQPTALPVPVQATYAVHPHARR